MAAPTIEVQVQQTRQLTPLVRELVLQPVAGQLPEFSAGSHIQLHLPVAGRLRINAYSLSRPHAGHRGYRIAVRLQEDSRGGSRHVHQGIAAGQRLRITAPANLFPLHSQARLHILVAGGIGITPFLSYIDELQRRGAAFELHYAHRAGLTDAYAAELAERLGPRFHAYGTDAGRPLDLHAVLHGRPVGSHVYTCGPDRLVQAVQAHARALGWPDARIHSEAFAGAEPGEAFSVLLARSGRRVNVAPEQSLLEALEDAGVAVPNLCRGGVCGQCATRYTAGAAGTVEHRDHFLSAQERNALLMPCVSRACGTALQLDL